MDPSFRDRRLLVVGAGGIGCELLKNLVLTGFKQIEVIDLDTIELSNLNRQFLFQKHHVGKSKSLIARESVLKYPCSETNQTEITSHHDSVMNPKYSVDYFRNFALVLNALDNRAARSHVNRLCLAANVPLIESGSAGYLGQVTVISRGLTECYDCLPKAPAKTFPGCTIRNTPSEPIHCVVWAKHLFNQLFGAEDPDEAVSPDGEDPENMAEAGQNALANLNKDQDIKRVSTRQWAKETNYNSQKLFGKLFNDDIKYLLSMSKLWEKRRPPTPLEYSESVDSTIVPGSNTEGQSTSSDFASLKVWTLGECVRVFERSVKELSARLDTETLLHWDKDDESALDFVASAANLRSAIFGIAQKSKFEVKSLAGNIIPAIASTNAIVAGLIVLQAIKVLAANMNDCRTVYLRDKPLLNKLIVSSQLEKPNPKCYVCASKPELAIKLDLNKFTIKQLETKILKQELNMVQPDVEIGDGSGRIIISSEEGETEENNDKVLSHFGITDQTRLKCDDFFQNYELVIVLHHCEKFDTATNAKDYEIVSDEQTVKDIQEAVQKETSKQKAAVEEEEKKREEVKKRKLDNNEDSNDEIIFEEDVVKQQRVSPSNQQKRSHEVAFSGENRPESTASVLSASHDAANGSSSSPDDEHASKKLRPDEENDDSNSINDASDVISDEEENNSNSISRPSISSLTNTTSSTAAHASSSTAAATTTGVMTSSRGGTDISKSTIVEEPDDDDVVIEDDDCIIEEEVSGDSNPNPNRSQQQQQQHRQMTIPVNFEDASVSSSEFISVNENGRKNGGESNTGREESSNTNGNNDEDDDVIECSGSESDEESGDEEEDDDALSSPMVPDEHLEREEDDDGDVIEIGDDDDSKQQQQ